MNISEKILNTLTDEQKKRIESANSPEEFLKIAKETGYELSEEELNAMSGGGWCDCDDYSCCPDDYGPRS